MEVSGDVVGIDDLTGQYCDDYKVDPTIILPQHLDGLGICQTSRQMSMVPSSAAAIKARAASRSREADGMLPEEEKQIIVQHLASWREGARRCWGREHEAVHVRWVSSSCSQPVWGYRTRQCRIEFGGSDQQVLRTSAVQQGIFILARSPRCIRWVVGLT